jgi:hypothetical protein
VALEDRLVLVDIVDILVSVATPVSADIPVLVDIVDIRVSADTVDIVEFQVIVDVADIRDQEQADIRALVGTADQVVLAD